MSICDKCGYPEYHPKIDALEAELKEAREKCYRYEGILKLIEDLEARSYVEDFNNDIMLCTGCVNRKHLARNALRGVHSKYPEPPDIQTSNKMTVR